MWPTITRNETTKGRVTTSSFHSLPANNPVTGQYAAGKGSVECSGFTIEVSHDYFDHTGFETHEMMHGAIEASVAEIAGRAGSQARA